MMREPKSPRELLIEEIRDLYSAESQLIRALPAMGAGATNEELRFVFEDRLVEARVHAARLEETMDGLHESPQGETSEAMRELIAEAQRLAAEEPEPAILDLALISAIQRVEQYKVAAYGCARTVAELAGDSHLASTFQLCLDEETRAEKRLNEIAMNLNLQATADDQSSSV